MRRDDPNTYASDPSRQLNIVTPAMQEMGARIRAGRHAAGISQRAVADRAGVSQSEVSRLERGRGGNISTYRFVAICFAIGQSFPFGNCPHNHNCPHTRPTAPVHIRDQYQEPPNDHFEEPPDDHALGLDLPILITREDSDWW